MELIELQLVNSFFHVWFHQGGAYISNHSLNRQMTPKGCMKRWMISSLRTYPTWAVGVRKSVLFTLCWSSTRPCKSAPSRKGQGSITESSRELQGMPGCGSAFKQVFKKKKKSQKTVQTSLISMKLRPMTLRIHKEILYANYSKIMNAFFSIFTQRDDWHL